MVPLNHQPQLGDLTVHFGPQHFLNVRDAAVRVDQQAQRHDDRQRDCEDLDVGHGSRLAYFELVCQTAAGCLTCARSTGIVKAMEVSLPETQEAQLNQEAVTRLLARNEWFKEQVQSEIDQIARGEFIEEEEMDARVKRRLTPEPHPVEARFSGENGVASVLNFPKCGGNRTGG